jgi:hypothetical protein
MSIAFPEYLAASTHSAAALAELVDAVRAGKPVNEWISARAGTADQGFDIEKMDQSFSRWIGSDTRYQCRR